MSIKTLRDSSSTVRMAAASLLFVFAFAATVGNVISTDKRVREYFKMKDYVGIIPEHVHAAILSELPVGSSRRDVQAFLRARGVGEDSVSACDETHGRAELDCSIGPAHHRWNLLNKTYRVSFSFDSSDRLWTVSAQSHFFWTLPFHRL